MLLLGQLGARVKRPVQGCQANCHTQLTSATIGVAAPVLGNVGLNKGVNLLGGNLFGCLSHCIPLTGCVPACPAQKGHNCHIRQNACRNHVVPLCLTAYLPNQYTSCVPGGRVRNPLFLLGSALRARGYWCCKRYTPVYFVRHQNPSKYKCLARCRKRYTVALCPVGTRPKRYLVIPGT